MPSSAPPLCPPLPHSRFPETQDPQLALRCSTRTRLPCPTPRSRSGLRPSAPSRCGAAFATRDPRAFSSSRGGSTPVGLRVPSSPPPPAPGNCHPRSAPTDGTALETPRRGVTQPLSFGDWRASPSTTFPGSPAPQRASEPLSVRARSRPPVCAPAPRPSGSGRPLLPAAASDAAVRTRPG